MSGIARVRHYARLLIMNQPTLAAPERNLIGLLANVFGFNSDEIYEGMKKPSHFFASSTQTLSRPKTSYQKSLH